jgi:hypothetical protein
VCINFNEISLNSKLNCTYTTVQQMNLTNVSRNQPERLLPKCTNMLQGLFAIYTSIYQCHSNTMATPTTFYNKQQLHTKIHPLIIYNCQRVPRSCQVVF